jgi:NAD+ diphosphatase
MKFVESNQLNDSSKYQALFFTKDGIIADSITHSPLFNFQNTIDKLGLIVDSIYLDVDLLIVQCKLPSKLPNIIQDQFCIYPAKSFLTKVSDRVQNRILRAIHWLHWNEQFQYCYKCGNKIDKVKDLTEKRCHTCQLSFYPNLAPAVMVLVQNNHQVLLARSAHFKPGIYSVIAGFIDIGESAEEAAHREVKEEVGIEISRLEYFGSQSWPFPNSFMIAYKAHYLSGELTIDKNEIEDAKWFHINDLPELPARPSISRMLIDSLKLNK